MTAARWGLRHVGGALLYVLEGLLVTAIALGLASAYLPPALFWWTGLPATVLPYLMLVLVATTFVMAWRRRWIRVVGYAFLAVVFVGKIGFAGVPSLSSTAPADDSLRVFSYNLTPQGNLGRTATRASLYDIVDEVRPHITAIQGAPAVYFRNPPRPSWPIDTLLATTYRLATEINPTGYRETHQPIFARANAPSLRYDRKELLRPTSSANPERPFARAQMTWKGQPISIYNVHLRSFERDAAYEALDDGRYFEALDAFLTSYRRNARQRADEAAALARIVADDPRPTLVVGDLNATPFHWEYRQLSRHLANAAPGAGIFSPTWHTRLPFVRIDHIFVSPEWNVTSTQTLSTPLSDHRPIAATLTLDARR